MPNLLAISYIIAIILGLIALIDLWKLGVLATVNIPYVIGMIIVLFTLRCLWTVFDKAGKASWAAIIPVYNCVVLCQIAGYSGRFVWLFFIPIVNVIAFLRVCKGLAEHFGRSTRFGIYLFLFFPIVLPILAFSKKIQHDYDVKTSSPIETAFPSVREYYETKAAVSEMLSASATAPLPPLPPQIDEAAAQECFVLAGDLETKGDHEKAVEQYTKAIHFNSRHTAAYFRRGTMLMDSSFKAAAITDFRRVIELADNPVLTEHAKENIAKLA
jgi:hypothetical protein